MNSLSLPFFVMTLLCSIWMVVTMARVYEYLRLREEKVNFLLMRLMFFDYLARYRRITTQSYGRPGHLYYQFVASAVGALLFALIAVLRMKSVV